MWIGNNYLTDAEVGLLRARLRSLIHSSNDTKARNFLLAALGKLTQIQIARMDGKDAS
jgi:hypothetical protein